jgi:GNAT superfamily N-acetyltransferase
MISGATGGTDMDYQLADATHEPQIMALGTRTLGWQDDPRYLALYRWKHEENAFGRSPRWVALDGDRVVGFRVFLRWRFRRADGATASAVRAVDTATDPDYQGRGIFRHLTTSAIDDLRADGVDFIFNTPNDQSRPGYLKMAWIELGRPGVAMAPRTRSLPRIAGSRVPADLWSQPSEVGQPANVLADPVLADPLLASAPATDAWQTDRSPAWLAWRYGLEPLQYRLLLAAECPGGDRHGDAGAVFRLRRRGAALEATVGDLFAPTPAARRFLLRTVRRATGADYVLARGTTAIEATPAFSLPAFSPLVTWRSVTSTAEPTIADFAFTVGDLELF